jgi:hypothetical protein
MVRVEYVSVVSIVVPFPMVIVSSLNAQDTLGFGEPEILTWRISVELDFIICGFFSLSSYVISGGTVEKGTIGLF